MITNFPDKKPYNPGGYLTFRFIPAALIVAYPMISNSSAVALIEFADGYEWLKGYATRGTLLYHEEPQIDDAGTVYIKTITGLAPGDSRELVDIMNLMPGKKYVVEISDRFGRSRLVGTPASPLEFSAVFDSGTDPSEEKGFRFTFTCLSKSRSPYYLG